MSSAERLYVRLVLMALAVVCGLLALAPLARAQVPHLIRYQGTAVDSNEVPLEGPYTITFRLYPAASGGTPAWTEAHTNVPLSKGHFSVLLGQNTALTAMDWSQPRWLGVQINGEPELSPRQQITSVPTAIMAERLSVPVTTSTIADDANALVPSGAIILWEDAGCPAGYTRLSAYDGKFLVASAAAGSTGGSNTHTHGAGSYVIPSHSHSDEPHFHTYYSDGNADFRSTSPPAGTTTTHGGTNSGGGGSVAGASGTADSRPEFRTVLLCKKD